MLVNTIAINRPILSNLLVIGVEAVEMVSALVTSEHRQNSVVLNFLVPTLVRITAVPDGRAGVVENDVIRMAVAATVIQEDVIGVRIVVRGYVDKRKIAWD